MTAGIIEHNGTQLVQGPTAQGDEDWEQDAWERDDAPEWAEEEDWEDEDDDEDEDEDDAEGKDG